MINTDMPGLLVAMAEVAAAADAQTERLKLGAAKRGTPVSCTTCTTPGCCYQQVATFIAEALYLAKLNPVPKDKRAEWIELGLYHERTDKTQFMEEAHPCVFLTPEGRCSVYQTRPGACRRLMVVSEPKLCMPGSRKEVLAVNTMEIDSAWVMTMVRMQVELLGMPMNPIMMGSLPRMVAIASEALEQPDNRSFRRFLRDQRWMSFDDAMAHVDPELIKQYGF